MLNATKLIKMKKKLFLIDKIIIKHKLWFMFINKISQKTLFCIITIICLIFFSSCSSSKNLKSKTDFKEGTICTISLPSNTDDKVFEECFNILGKVEDQLARTDLQSEIGQLNKNKTAILSADVFSLFRFSYNFCIDSEGAFNPCIGAAVSLWDIGGKNPRIPSKQELNSVDTNYFDVVIDETEKRVTIPKNMEIDLGGIGKGYSANKIRDYLTSENINHAIINLGGNILLIGSKSKSDDWTIGLQDPNKDAGLSYILLSLSNTSIVTSGTYERFFEKDGIRYHHILSSKTLYPAQSDIISSTIISKNSTLCDVLSTTCFVLGSQKALEFLNQYKDVSAIFLLKDGTIVTTSNFNYSYKIINENYHFN